MPKITNDNDIKEKLDYIGLDLGNIPEFFNDVKQIDYRPLKANEDNGYKVYKYVYISKIHILLTPTNRLNTIKEKYSKASSLKTYLKPETEEDIIKHTTFLKMLKNVQIEEIEELINEQEMLNKQIPFKVKFEENYLWQIYYSDIDDTYFMLVPTEDLEYGSFFYLLKKQIEYHRTKKDEMIFVPIVYENYSNEYLKNSEISDIEKYLWFFTKNWSNIYDVYDREQNLSIHIVGQTIVYDNIKCIYKNQLGNKEESLKFYKFLKALFILSTELPHNYKFQVKLNRYGELEFEYENEKITYDNMFSMLAKNYEKARDRIIALKKEKNGLEDKLEELKLVSNRKDQEYLLKEKQIATYLECRKTFFGKVKYFFRAKKKNKISIEQKVEPSQENQFKKEHEEVINANLDLKEFYTVEDIVKIYKELDEISNHVKNLKMDEKALQNKIESIEIKIKNANLYIEEIDNHEKSIFEFWRFANKDESLMLNQGTTFEKENKRKIEKVYSYKEDKDEIANLVDKEQRNSLSKEETDGVYIAIDNLNIINNIDNEEILKQSLSELKEELQNQRVLFEEDKIDIFGGMTEDSTKIKMLGGKKHRETKKDKLKILNITKDTSIDEYKEKLLEILNNVNKCLKKTKELVGIPVYIAVNENEELKNLQICSLNPEEVINECEKDVVNLYRINLKEDTKVVYFSNSIYYDNYNKTLPIGMDISDKCLMDFNKYKLKQKCTNNFRVSNLDNEFKIETKEILLTEFELEEAD